MIYRRILAAWIAADRAMDAGERAGHPMLVAAGAFRLVFVFLAARHYDQAEETATAAKEFARSAVAALWPFVTGPSPHARGWQN